MAVSNELSVTDIIKHTRGWFSYLVSKWLLIGVTALLFAIIGITYAWTRKPVYNAEITFLPENEGNSSLGYAGIAAQFGIDLGGNTGNSFSGENLRYLLGSQNMITTTLLSNVSINDTNQLLIDYYIKVGKLNEGWEKDKKFRDIRFTPQPQPNSRVRDSIVKGITADVGKMLTIEKIDKKADILSVKMTCDDELFAKAFVETLVDNVIEHYTEYKVKKSKQNVEILQRQTDSVSRLITGNIQSIAVSNDLNVNPLRQVVRTGVQRRQVDAQVNGAIYTELAKNLELSKLALRKETPLIHIIDTPVLPLDKKKMGRLKGGIIFGFIGGLLGVCVAIFMRLSHDDKKVSATMV
jgi:hypothetical protein